jgi:predicted molibdopterin-dependent oxidoreductase YjgC
VKCLWVFSHDLFASGWAEAEVMDALRRVETVVYSGPNANGTSALAHYVLPSAAWVEREGTFTNFEGRVQRFRTAVEPLGEARADCEVLGTVLAVLGDTAVPPRPERWFRELAQAVPAFAGLGYQGLGDSGRMVAGAAPVPGVEAAR